VAEDQGLSIQILEGLMEVDMGEWDGRTFEELFREEGELVGKWMRNPSSVTIPGGEDFGAVRDRVMCAVREITSRHPGDQRVLVVTHGGPIRGILCEALGMQLDGMFRIQIDLASISAVRYFDGGISETAIVTLVNETYHLR
jgi:alpha-ribazole phosphatase